LNFIDKPKIGSAGSCFNLENIVMNTFLYHRVESCFGHYTLNSDKKCIHKMKIYTQKQNN